MRLTKSRLKRIIKEEFDIVLEFAGDPELADPEAGSVEAEREKADRAAAAASATAVKVSSAIASIGDKDVYVEVLKDILLGTKLTTSEKKEAFQKLFGVKEGEAVYDTIAKLAPAIAR